MNAPFVAPSIDVWLSWQPEISSTDALHLRRQAGEAPAHRHLRECGIGIHCARRLRGLLHVALQPIVEVLVLRVDALRDVEAASALDAGAAGSGRCRTGTCHSAAVAAV